MPNTIRINNNYKITIIRMQDYLKVIITKSIVHHELLFKSKGKACKRRELLRVNKYGIRWSIVNNKDYYKMF